MKIAVASDHAGFDLKQKVGARLKSDGYDVLDLGAYDESPSDYPDIARSVGEAVAAGKVERAVFVCGSGVGASIAANKIKGIRAGVCHDTYSAHQAVEHDDANVLCIGSRVIGESLALEVVLAFVQARFSGEERHLRRVGKILDIERQQL
jgi:ribose 5-phosphate isomerase B